MLLTEEHSAAAIKRVCGRSNDLTLLQAVLWALFSMAAQDDSEGRCAVYCAHSFGLYLAHPLVLRLWNEWTTRRPQVTYLHLWQMFALVACRRSCDCPVTCLTLRSASIWAAKTVEKNPAKESINAKKETDELKEYKEHPSVDQRITDTLRENYMP